ncbi:MAG: hypothetical protein CL536_03420 [Alcaligenaceae bacterium]|nr:hypothetical protein [Alcaligenaceae bacterium]
MTDPEIQARLKWSILVGALKMGRLAKIDDHLDVLIATKDFIEAGHKDTGEVVMRFDKKDLIGPPIKPRITDVSFTYYTETGARL